MRRAITRNPVPSLLRSLMSEHLDPGYAAAAHSRRHTAGRPSVRSTAVWTALGTLSIGVVFGFAISQVADHPSDAPGVQRETVATVRAATNRADDLEAQRSALVAEVDTARETALASSDAGGSVLTDLRSLEVAAGATSASGPGITVVVSEPASPASLSDASRRTRGSAAAVIDRDLQVVVNSLWVSGAEAIAVGDVRIGPNVTIRQAGGAMLVDNRPVPSPYSISAIGSPSQLQARFSVSDAYLRMSALSQLYRVGFDVRPDNDLQLPAATARPVSAARPEGSP
ncbi:DUF881 domain-containing protein [Rhodococcoides yunnanense]|uniref:DUF881 domain-containing protein n=1 Tax=Rhodococcoides yunnanense TaxID=278209 RepID=UPI0009329057|nr:DUF881 domain-containing protein [Rhodococcus yunnanensis]